MSVQQPYRHFEDLENMGNLKCIVDQLLPDEVAVATSYVERLLKSRPVKTENRTHMATLELEGDPK